MVMTESVEAVLLCGGSVYELISNIKEQFRNLREDTGEVNADVVVGGRRGVVTGAGSSCIQRACGVVEGGDQVVEGATGKLSVSGVVADLDH